MRLKFTKMQGLGNDFVVLDGITQRIDLSAPQLKRLADRHFGVGCDQILVVEKPSRDDIDFRYRIFNADGGEVEQCGNGARCFVQFVRNRGLTAKRVIRVETKGGIIEPRMEDDGQITVDMGIPRFASGEIPFTGGSGAIVQPLELDGASISMSVVSMGNPHAVQIVDDVDDAPVLTQGPRIERHPRFQNGVNAGYMQVVDRANIRLRVWERGAGETPACGTGACAAVVAGVRRGLLDSNVRVATRGGNLTVGWKGDEHSVSMKGAATSVFEGVWETPLAQADGAV
ncbi:MAG: diaminopimelate epimerase [Betaproteobacteria bacterium]|nr:MAG: diaminopimelate epimerase [Betaproteobacteria bacterium]